MTFCKHYRAMANFDTCEAGVDFTKWRPLQHDNVPCWRKHGEPCELQDWPTPEELKAEEDKINRFIEQLVEGKVCPHCQQPIDHKEQVGRCVYARPCGCRLYQGKL